MDVAGDGIWSSQKCFYSRWFAIPFGDANSRHCRPEMQLNWSKHGRLGTRHHENWHSSLNSRETPGPGPHIAAQQPRSWLIQSISQLPIDCCSFLLCPKCKMWTYEIISSSWLRSRLATVNGQVQHTADSGRMSQQEQLDCVLQLVFFIIYPFYTENRFFIFFHSSSR